MELEHWSQGYVQESAADMLHFYFYFFQPMLLSTACIWLQTQHKKAAGYFHSSTCDQKSCSIQTIILHDALQQTQHTNRFSLTTQKCRQSLITCLSSSNLLPELALNHAPMPRCNFLDRVKMYLCFEISLLLGLVVCCWAN